jgi:hypothetical protein
MENKYPVTEQRNRDSGKGIEEYDQEQNRTEIRPVAEDLYDSDKAPATASENPVQNDLTAVTNCLRNSKRYLSQLNINHCPTVTKT